MAQSEADKELARVLRYLRGPQYLAAGPREYNAWSVGNTLRNIVRDLKERKHRT